MSDEVTQVLQKAYDILEARGWCQGTFAQDDGKVCLDGAVIQALDLTIHAVKTLKDGSQTVLIADENRELYSTVKNRLTRLTYAEARRGIWDWNDAPERTIEDVKLLLKKAIHN